MILEKLIKLLKLEQAQGTKNRAVIGGLIKFKLTWEMEAVHDSIPKEIIERISSFLINYENLAYEKRVLLINEIFSLIQDIAIPSTEIGDHSDIHFPPQTNSFNQLNNKDQLHKIRTARTYNNMVPIETLPGLDSPLTILSGIGASRANLLNKLSIYSLGDLLYYFPRRYDDYSKLKTINHIQAGESLTIIGAVQTISTFQIKNSKRLITQALISDSSGSVQLKWFNNPFVEKQLKPGTQIIISGKVDKYLGKHVINHPTWELLDTDHLHTNRIVPIYPSTANITQRTLRTITYQCVNHWAPKIPEILPESILENYGLINISQALNQIHFPENESNIELARNRLAFDEIFMLQMGVLQQKQKWETSVAKKYEITDAKVEQFISRLPFFLTASQLRSISEIRQDLNQTHPMNRLLQGDVGSGKTVVAALALLIICNAKAQSAIMVPTSILANQHFATLQNLLCYTGGIGVDQIRLLTSDTLEAEKEEIRELLLNGNIKILVGTHALIEDPIKFQNLQLAIIDEQHRFGVDQRTMLREKGSNPHLLVMSATPIPRSLSLTLYGDLDLSVLDEMPQGRATSSTAILLPSEKYYAYKKINEEVMNGHQTFIVYPLIDQMDADSNMGAVQEFERLQKDVFPQFQIGLLHGRLHASEKQQIMQRFRNGEFQILVSTTVIEVGMDIPNATVMIIESANRFGLAQLHQLRGRVGRGSAASFCFLITESDDSVENERLKAMKETNDGFVLAEKDLIQRGPGDFLGARQAGFIGFKMASFSDIHIIEKARECAKKIFTTDNDLSAVEHQNIRKAYNRYWLGTKSDIS